MTPAYVKEAFLAAALALAQRKVDHLDERYGDEVLKQLDEMKKHLRKMKDPESAGYLDDSEGPVGFRRWES